MPRRVRHAARFALTTLLSVYVASALWELLDIYVLGNLPSGASAWATFLFNEQVWRTIAIIESVVVFLLKLGDLTTDPPSWLYAWLSGAWVAIATITIGVAVEERLWWTAVIIAVIAIAMWYLTRNRIPGRPGTNEYDMASIPQPERKLP